MKKELKLVENVLTTTVTNIITPILLEVEFESDTCFCENENGDFVFDCCELTIGRIKENCYHIFKNLPALRKVIKQDKSYCKMRGSFGTATHFMAEFECLLDLETKQIFYTDNANEIHEITQYVPIGVVQWHIDDLGSTYSSTNNKSAYTTTLECVK